MNTTSSQAKLPWKTKLQLVLVALVCTVVGLWLSSKINKAIRAVLRETAAGLSIIEFDASDFVCIPLAAAAFLMAAMACFPQPLDRKRRRKKPLREKIGEVMLGCFALSAFMTPLAVPIGRLIMSDIVSARGYHVCSVKGWRRPPMRWARAGISCPTE